MNSARFSGDSVAYTSAVESVIAPPMPNTDWKRLAGATKTEFSTSVSLCPVWSVAVPVLARRCPVSCAVV